MFKGPQGMSLASNAAAASVVTSAAAADAAATSAITNAAGKTKTIEKSLGQISL